MERVLNILYQSDNNYATLTGVSMTSLLENNKDIDEINIYILNDNIHEENLEKAKELCGKYNRKIEIVDTEAIVSTLKKLNVTPWKGGYSTWLKLFSINNLTLPTDRVLYLDGDTLINGSLAPLCEFDFEDNILAMTCDCVVKAHKREFGISTDEKYYNAGVILFNKEAWISEKCEEQICYHLKNIRSDYLVVEQDLINDLFRNKIKYLSIRYNFQSYYLLYDIKTTLRAFGLNEQNFVSYNEVNEASENPIVHHMLGAPAGRPWERDNIHPLNDLYDKYLKMSPWYDSEKIIVEKSISLRIQRVSYRFLPKCINAYIHMIGQKIYLGKLRKLSQNRS